MTTSPSRQTARRGAVRPADDLVAAERAFARGEDALCEAYLTLATPKTADEAGRFALLRARLAFASNDVETARDAAKSAARAAADTTSGIFASALQAAAARRCRADAEAEKLFRHVVARLHDPLDQPAAQAAALAAADALTTGNVAGAAALLERISRRPGFPEAALLRGRIELERNAPLRAGAHFVEALDELERSGDDDVRTRAEALIELADAAIETLDRGLSARAKRTYEALAWPPSLAEESGRAALAMSTLALVDGRADEAWVLAREAAATAPSAAGRARAEIACADLSRLMGDRAAHAIQLRRASTLLREAEHAGRPADPQTYAAFAIAAADAMPAEARKALAGARVDGDGVTRAQRRAVAFESVARARVAEAGGNADRATSLYERALARWVELEDRLQAALAALDMSRVGYDHRYLDHAERAVALAPRAWFRDEVTGNDGPVAQLTYAERGVLRELLAGKTTREIASESNRSEYTISNHLRRVFAAFDAHSRSRVLARCIELGITAETLDRTLR